MKKSIIIAFTILPLFTLNAQVYQTGLGVRGGGTNGLTVKHFIAPEAALEGILTTRWHGFMLTGLYEIHNDLDVAGLYWFYGAGGHVGFFGGYADHPWFDDDKDYTVIGIDGIIGLEYVFTEVPLAISVDWKPALNLSGYSGFWFGDGGLAVRYTFR